MENIEIEEKIKKENRKIILFAIIGIIEIVFVAFMFYQNGVAEHRIFEEEQKRIEKMLFNGAFEKHCSGNPLLGSQVKNLIKEVYKSNEENENRYVSIEGKYTDAKEIKSPAYYTVHFDYDDGYINSIYIEDCV